MIGGRKPSNKSKEKVAHLEKSDSLGGSEKTEPNRWREGEKETEKERKNEERKEMQEKRK